ncbi:MAG TPA: hypothetical protein VL523_15045 [Terriglobia bacterium]|nr:hypothetical protein [Terriglobia bacterium]
MTRRKMIVAYACLVGLPLLGLLGILHAGQRLKAPVSVAGAWNLKADFNAWAGKPCGELLSKIKQPFFTISQSGNGLMVALNSAPAATLTGSVKGTSLIAGADAPQSSAGADNCSSPDKIHLAATVEGQAPSRALTGLLSLNACAGCAPIAFHAVRQSARPEGGR